MDSFPKLEWALDSSKVATYSLRHGESTSDQETELETYTLFVDESGDSGIRNIREEQGRGASRYFVLGAVLVPDSLRKNLNSELDKLTLEFGKTELHCSSLKHTQIVRFSQKLNQQRVLCFGVMSNKTTLREYKSQIKNDHAMFFHKCAQYLLERVGDWARSAGVSGKSIHVQFEEGIVQVEKLRTYIDWCQMAPQHPNAKFLAYLDKNRIHSRAKFDCGELRAADLVAHSLYRCLEKTNHNNGILESRYLQEIQHSFYGDQKTNQVLNFGLKLIHNLDDLELEGQIAAVLRSLRSSTTK